jgi:hypothetical protein
MRLSEIVIHRTIRAIENLKILDAERSTLDWEVTPQVIIAQGGDGPITVFTISLLGIMPHTLGDHCSFTETMMDPYSPQGTYDTMLERLLELIHEAQARDVPAGLRKAEPRSEGGLYLPR